MSEPAPDAHPVNRTGGGWGAVAGFFLYRLTVAALLILLFIAGTAPTFLGQQDPTLYTLASSGYLGLVLASGILLYLRRPASPDTQVAMMILADIAAFTLILHASGGVQSGLGTLLALSIAAGGLLIPGPRALLFAALATLAVLAQQLVTGITLGPAQTSYPQAGLLGASFFAIALLAHVLTLRLSRSERLVSQQEVDLANLEQLNEYVIQHMETGIVVTDRKRHIRLLNESAWYLLGMPDAGTRAPLEQASRELARQLKQWNVNPKGELNPFTPTPGGRELQASFSRLGHAEHDGAVIFIEDTATITQRAQQIKLASLGRLTASIAHEIRNPLGAISHAQQLLRESPVLGPGEQRLMQIIGRNSERVNAIIEDVLQLSRRSMAHPETIALAAWVADLMPDFVTSTGIDRGQASLRITPEQARARVDPGQLRQIVINLLENAVRHFDRDPGELRIRVNGGFTPGSGNPFLDIIDNGPGIDPETARQMFEPFFTTRNEGTGLGLYIARELSEFNRINLEYIAVPTGGSCFRISFPNPGGNRSVPPPQIPSPSGRRLHGWRR